MIQLESPVVIIKGRYTGYKGVVEAFAPNKVAYVRFIGRPNWEQQADFVELDNLMLYEQK